MSETQATAQVDVSTFDCPGNYIAANPSPLRCAKCNRPLDVKDAQRTPTGYVCPYYVRARVATFYNANLSHYVVTALIALVLGVVAGFVLSLVGGVGFFAIILTIFVAPVLGGVIAEAVRRAMRAMGNARGQHTWLVSVVASGVGAGAVTVLPALALLAAGFFSLFALIPVLGLAIMLSTLAARLRW